jgi:radical SAM/Cys-rich protein
MTSLPIVSDATINPFAMALQQHGRTLRRIDAHTLQVNVGKVCNQACRHCHVDAGPARTETMNAATAERVLWLLERHQGITTLDITGGAPELCAQFRRLVTGARRLGRAVIDRCNLTILSEPGHEDLVDFLAEHNVGIVASMPCHSQKNVDAQRGGGVFERSIDGLQRLNRHGFGTAGGRRLDLVYNPGAGFLPGPQQSLENDYKRILLNDHGIVFHHLFTITNVPILRFAGQLERDGKLGHYQALLEQHFNPHTIDDLMCRSLISISYDGRIFDCDFNQMLNLDITPKQTIFDVDDLSQLQGEIRTGSHCFACTAGAGSSCGGALTMT